MTDRDNIIRMAREAGFAFHDNALICINDGLPDREIRCLERIAGKVIADFLQRTGQYLTNDASREAVISAAVAEEREACAQACSAQAERWRAAAPSDSIWPFVATECEKAIRARGRHG